MPELIKLVVPVGFGLLGLIMAGLIGAILSSIDSMVNSAATLIVFDIYKKHFNPESDDSRLLTLGKWTIAILIVGSGALALVTYDPGGSGNFFLRVSSQAGHFTPGLIVAFALGMFWRGANKSGSVAAIVLGPLFSFGIVAFYDRVLGGIPEVAALLGENLNFLHRVFATTVFCTLVGLVVSRATRSEEAGSRFTFEALSGVDPRTTGRLFLQVAVVAALLLSLGFAVHLSFVPARAAAWIGAIMVWGPFLPFLRRVRQDRRSLLADDRTWAALLTSVTVFLMYRFF